MITKRIIDNTDQYYCNLAYIQAEGTDFNPILPCVSELLRLNRPIKVPKISAKETDQCIPIYWGQTRMINRYKKPNGYGLIYIQNPNQSLAYAIYHGLFSQGMFLSGQTFKMKNNDT